MARSRLIGIAFILFLSFFAGLAILKSVTEREAGKPVEPLILPTALPPIALSEPLIEALTSKTTSLPVQEQIEANGGLGWATSNSSDYGRLVTIGYTFQCAKITGPGSYINYYQYGILYLNALEDGLKEWERLSPEVKNNLYIVCNGGAKDE